MQVLGRRTCVKEFYGHSINEVQRDNACLVNFISFEIAPKKKKKLCRHKYTHKSGCGCFFFFLDPHQWKSTELVALKETFSLKFV